MNSQSVIQKHPEQARVTPNLVDYAATRRSFSWQHEAAHLSGLPNGGLNIAFEALDRHADSARASQRAIRFIGADLSCRDFSYAQLRAEANRFANVLQALGLGRHTCVATFLGRCPELYIAALGTLKAGGIYLPLFSVFGPEPLATRLELSGAQVLVTTEALYRRKLSAIREKLPALKHVLLIRSSDKEALPADTHNLSTLLAAADENYTTVATRPEDIALMHFTSGTTGKPKGVLHAHQAVLMHEASARFALDLHEQDICWCTADPGWVTGVSYGMLAPLVCGVSLIVDTEEFEVERWYTILSQQSVSVWYTAPTAIRMLMKAGLEPVRKHQYPALRFLASVGEPLHPEGVCWGVEAFGLPFHDNWWQTETGGIMIANYAAMEVRPGSMGKPLPGIEAAVARRTAEGGIEFIEAPDTTGELVLRSGWPSMFRGYLNDEARYKKCFADGWYFTSDLVRRDADGYYWFVGRADDVIKSSGHLIGPFEVEAALLTHPSVAQAGVIGIPDAMLGELVKAFVELKPGFNGDDALRRELLGHTRKLLGPAVAPREIVFVASLPRTRSGKIMRRLLKARELGLPEGDLSTLEGAT